MLDGPSHLFEFLTLNWRPMKKVVFPTDSAHLAAAFSRKVKSGPGCLYIAENKGYETVGMMPNDALVYCPSQSRAAGFGKIPRLSAKR